VERAIDAGLGDVRRRDVVEAEASALSSVVARELSKARPDFVALRETLGQLRRSLLSVDACAGASGGCLLAVRQLP
jgi:hypothetical protein